MCSALFLVGLAVFTVGSLPLMAVVAGREGLGPFRPQEAVVVVVVSALLLTAAVRGLGRAGGERMARRLGEHRRPEEVYGPDAVPVRPVLVALGVLPMLLAALVAAVLATSDTPRGAFAVVLPLVAAGLVPVCGAQLGRSTLVVVTAPWCVATAIVALRLPWPVPAGLLLVQAVAGWAVLIRWLRRRTRARPSAAPASAAWPVLTLASAEGPGLAVAVDPGQWVVPRANAAPTEASTRRWARTTARRRWGDAERPPYDGDVAGLAGRLEACVRGLAPTATGATVLLHLPVPWAVPLPVHLESWARADDADQAVLGSLVEVDLASAAADATVGSIRTRNLGDGIKALVEPAPEGDVREAVLSYAWRLAPYGLDLRVQASAADASRLADAVGDIEALLDLLTVGEHGDARFPRRDRPRVPRTPPTPRRPRVRCPPARPRRSDSR